MKTINIDRNLSVRNYDNFTANEHLLVSSHFYTVQGEGPYAGQPAFFIRLAGCNIGLKQDCQFCDTAFAYEAGRPWDRRLWEATVIGRPASLVVITGGEPLLQWPTLKKFIEGTNALWPELHFQIETNGMLLTEEMMAEIEQLRIVVVMSPKIGHRQLRHRPLPDWLDRFRYFYLKYVVEDVPLSPYYCIPEEAIAKFGKNGHVYVSGITAYNAAPEGVPSFFDSCIDGRQTSLNMARAAKIVKLNNLRLTCQMHLLAAIE